MAAIDDLVNYVNNLLENAGGALENEDEIRNDVLPILSKARQEAIREVATLADPVRPEVSFFGVYGPQVADWLNRLARDKAVGER